MTKTAVALFTFILFSFISYGQAPESFKYQAVVRDGGNVILNNQTVGMRLTIQQGMIGGPSVYSETFQPTSNAYGIVNLEIGTGTTMDNFSAIDWSNGPYFIETAIDITGGTSYTVMGTSQLLSVPYALHAKTAESIVGGSQDEFYLGQDTLGGIVFYLYRDEMGDQRGLIVSTTESSEQWQTAFATTGADRTWDGAYNTALMTNSPAKNWVTSNFTPEWYVPSIDELNILWNNRFHVNKALNDLGATLLANTATYWSSQESTQNNAWFFYFVQGYANATANNKTDTRRVRAVRAF